MKKIIKTGLLSTLILIILCLLGFYLQNYLVEKSLEKFNKEPLGDDYALIRCNLNVFNPEFAYIFFTGDEGNISFDTLSKIIWKSEDWKQSYVGGTTIKNTTFPELVKMVKKDCEQFKKGHGDYYGDELAWSYSPYELEPEKTEEMKEQEELREQALEREVQWKKDTGEIRSVNRNDKEAVRAEFKRIGVPPEAIEGLIKKQFGEIN